MTVGRIYGILGTYMDVTMSKPAQDALRQSEERFRAFVENAYVGIAKRIQPADGSC